MIPDFQTLMLPVLKAVSGERCSNKDIHERLAKEFSLTDAERNERSPSGSKRFYHRISWAIHDLKMAGLIASPERGSHIATDKGKKVLKRNPAQLSRKDLEEFKEYMNRSGGATSTHETDSEQTEEETPEETLDRVYGEINANLAGELLERVRTATPQFFEQLVIDLLMAMGYGGTPDAGRVLGQSGDGGVDGMINQDSLGVDRVYVQAKRNSEDHSVSPDKIRDFSGALSANQASKGIFFTTSTFTSAAIQVAKEVRERIVLIDGAELSELMVRHGVGCDEKATLSLKRIDDAYFDDE